MTAKVQGQGARWCFTLNNYTDEDVRRLSVIGGDITYICFGKEVGDSGTPHLQGLICFSKRHRFKKVSEIVGKQAHIELCRNVNASIQYCKKDGDYVEVGSISTQGSRNDLEAFKAAVLGGEFNLKRLRQDHSEVIAKYPRFAMEYISDNIPKRSIEEHVLHDWQKSLKERLDSEPDDRSIVFVVDYRGNSGKTWFAHWYCSLHDGCQVIQPAKKADMAYVLDATVRVLFIDAPRSKQGEYLQYDFLEDVKNGYVFSTKYESRVKELQKVHVVCLMNEDPDMAKLSSDRYNVIKI